MNNDIDNPYRRQTVEELAELPEYWWYCWLIEPIKRGDLPAIQRHLARMPESLHTEDLHYWDPFILAAGRPDPASLRLLLQHEAVHPRPGAPPPDERGLAAVQCGVGPAYRPRRVGVRQKAAGIPKYPTEYLVPITNAASIFGRIFPGHLGDLYGVFNVCIVFTLFSGIISLALWLPAESTGPSIAFAVLYGFASGLTLAIIPALVAAISDIRKLGFRVGTLYPFSSFGALFGSPIVGAIMTSQHGGYSGLRIFCGVMLVTGGILISLSRISLVGPVLLVKK
ncbi:hypothetical protein SLS53_004379 [Cytospora paraplurivora]|uniref:Uncharacterized protein n=1 Tax=Cytospora paraplurivora TaxID=2898453 RepID=A0AAN9UFU4_9PEZI